MLPADMLSCCVAARDTFEVWMNDSKLQFVRFPTQIRHRLFGPTYKKPKANDTQQSPI